MNYGHHFLWLVLINLILIDPTATTHLLHKQSQAVFEKFFIKAYVKYTTIV